MNMIGSLVKVGLEIVVVVPFVSEKFDDLHQSFKSRDTIAIEEISYNDEPIYCDVVSESLAYTDHDTVAATFVLKYNSREEK